MAGRLVQCGAAPGLAAKAASEVDNVRTQSSVAWSKPLTRLFAVSEESVGSLLAPTSADNRFGPPEGGQRLRINTQEEINDLKCQRIEQIGIHHDAARS
ncbi:hypothetical protein DTW90_17220 [Neorhizobium sp. P12A]|nr:hypothetical protein DTW90_17220 [Neorhizobium sp. P12A]